MKLHINVTNIRYEFLHNNKTKCIIWWKNPLTGNTQRSEGVSRCNSEDKYDETLGKRIAEGRAKIAMWNSFNVSTGGVVLSIVDRNTKFIIHEEHHIAKLIDNQNK